MKASRSQNVNSECETSMMSRVEVTRIENIVKEIDEKDEKETANLIFGLIAASLSMVALRAFDSTILTFDELTDYFIFWGWCVMGAVFAKSWILSIYKNISGKGGNSNP